MALRVEATLKIHSQMVKNGRKKDLEHGKVLSLLIASAISGLIPVALGFTCVLMSWGWGGAETGRKLVCPSGEVVGCNLSLSQRM